MTERRPGRGSDQFPLRLPQGMRGRIKEMASDNGRSMNAEILHLIEMGIEWEELINTSMTGNTTEQEYKDIEKDEIQPAHFAPMGEFIDKYHKSMYTEITKKVLDRGFEKFRSEILSEITEIMEKE